MWQQVINFQGVLWQRGVLYCIKKPQTAIEFCFLYLILKFYGDTAISTRNCRAFVSVERKLRLVPTREEIAASVS